jgi:putative membrane protein
MKKLYMAILCLSFCTFGCMNNKSSTDPRIERADEADKRILENLKGEKNSAFAVNATESGIMEVETGRIALQKTANPDVKEFAQRMIDEHSTTNEKLKSIAAKKNIVLPVYINQENQNKIKALQEKSGNDFDKAYIDLMVDTHKNDMDQFKKASEQLEDVDLKKFAINNLHTLASHLDMARRIQDKINKPVILK